MNTYSDVVVRLAAISLAYWKRLIDSMGSYCSRRHRGHEEQDRCSDPAEEVVLCPPPGTQNTEDLDPMPSYDINVVVWEPHVPGRPRRVARIIGTVHATGPADLAEVNMFCRHYALTHR